MAMLLSSRTTSHQFAKDYLFYQSTFGQTNLNCFLLLTNKHIPTKLSKPNAPNSPTNFYSENSPHKDISIAKTNNHHSTSSLYSGGKW
ncbi:hypothetical protein CsatA_020838 [Cannabis sativa]